MNIYEKLTAIQNELKAPKNLKNDFGGFRYRNFEAICEGLKPMLKKHGCAMSVTDDIRLIGDRYYVEATCRFYDCESGESIITKALAREPAAKKGMDEPQVSGTASSYARKYCASALMLIDDNKDPDSNEYVTQTELPLEPGQTFATKKQIKVLKNFLATKGISENEALKEIGAEDFDHLRAVEYNRIITMATEKGKS